MEQEQQFSEAVVKARSLAWAAEARWRELRRSGASAEEVDAADAEYMRLANVAVGILEDEKEVDEEEARLAKRDAALAAPFEAKVRLAVDTLRAYGPMTATDMSGRRLKGLSNNYVRPVLQEAERRGLVERTQSGHKALWMLTP